MNGQMFSFYRLNYPIHFHARQLHILASRLRQFCNFLLRHLLKYIVWKWQWSNVYNTYYSRDRSDSHWKCLIVLMYATFKFVAACSPVYISHTNMLLIYINAKLLLKDSHTRTNIHIVEICIINIYLCPGR